jgi:hypothetical protein
MCPPESVIDASAQDCAKYGSKQRFIFFCSFFATRSQVPVDPKAKSGLMFSVIPLDKFTSPLGGQVIELQQLDYDAGGMSLLRTRIRERSRFTVFEVDPLLARVSGARRLLRWADSQPPPKADSATTETGAPT